MRALASVGLRELVAPILRQRCDELELDSWFRREPASIERNLAVFDAVAAYWNATHDHALVDDVLGVVVKAAHWVERARARQGARIAAPTARAASRSLAVLASALRSCGQPDAADDLQSFAERKERIYEKLEQGFRKADPQPSEPEKEAARKKAMDEEFKPDELKRLNAGVSNGGYHYLGAAKILAPIGQAFAEAVVEMKAAD